ncbi:MAG: SMC-Scp complex subunit ScpB [Planctomycetes bacterium]|nr:SMC-Scp complex subunit ScpB [Planctomycetota bacterium]
MTEINNKTIVESLLFVSAEPLEINAVRDVIGRDNITPSEIKNLLDELAKEYDAQNRAFCLKEIAGGYQLFTREEFVNYIKQLGKRNTENKLTSAALETLSIIAYKQPVNKADLESIRGVQTGQLLKALMEKGLVKIAGRQDVPGKPLLYGTTDDFLQVLGLKSVEELPKPEELGK